MDIREVLPSGWSKQANKQTYVHTCVHNELLLVQGSFRLPPKSLIIDLLIHQGNVTKSKTTRKLAIIWGLRQM